MCVDSPLGNSATYLTVDVPNWIRSHLPVAQGSKFWAVGGYSQGGTCAAQFGFGHPDLFKTTLSISGELDPTIGPSTVKDGFGGSQAAYDAAKPSALLTKNEPFTDAYAIFGVGQDDQKYQREIRQMLADAQDAGIETEFIQSPHSAHDWNTVRYVLKQATPSLMAHIGLGR
jgi:S-formylglutathione hydrolase FrmB